MILHVEDVRAVVIEKSRKGEGRFREGGIEEKERFRKETNQSSEINLFNSISSDFIPKNILYNQATPHSTRYIIQMSHHSDEPPKHIVLAKQREREAVRDRSLTDASAYGLKP